MELNTERLRLIPLNLENMKLLIKSKSKLEEKLGLKVTNSIIEEPLKSALIKSYDNMLKDSDNYIFNTNWEVILKDENRSIAGIMIKGTPNEKGEVEIGYGTDPNYQGRGYMTEAAGEIVRWLLDNPKVKVVKAETYKDNIPSHRVLEKIGMSKYKETQMLYCWKVDK